MKKLISNTLLFAIVFLIALSVPFLFSGNIKDLQTIFSTQDLPAQVLKADKQKNSTMGEEELVNLIKPATVRIIQHVKGEATIPAFTIDLKNLNIKLLSTGKSVKIPIDTYLTGSGFIVSPSGYVLTNAHVASSKIVKIEALMKVGTIILADEAMNMGKEGEEILNNMDNDEGKVFARKILDFLEEKSSFDIEEEELVVVDASSSKENFKDLLADGFPATIEYSNDNFVYDDKDIALIKISLENLPAVSMSKESFVTVGENIYAFGFPASAELGGANLLEATFTKGVVSALKDSENKDFKIIQTDAKVSQGSSGGPMFNKRGEIVGLVTFQTGLLAREAGDNFAFAIPASISAEAFDKARFVPKEDNYSLRLKNGINLLSQKRCQRALAEFKLAKDVNRNFSVDEYVSGYIEECNELIAAGRSIDTNWDEFLEWLRSTNYAIVGISGAVIVILILIIVIISMGRRGAKRDAEIDSLEERFEKQDATRVNNGPNTGSLPPVTVMAKPPQAPQIPQPQAPAAPVPQAPQQPAISPQPKTPTSTTITPPQVNPVQPRPVVSTPTPQIPQVPPQREEAPQVQQTTQAPVAPQQMQPTQPQAPQQMPATRPDPKLMQYTKNLKNIGFSNDEIVADLTKEGFTEAQIREALK